MSSNATNNLPSVLNVLVDDTSDEHGQEGEVPAGHEHDSDAQHYTEQRKGPELNKNLLRVHPIL